jgi:hypothetical protein
MDKTSRQKLSLVTCEPLAPISEVNHTEDVSKDEVAVTKQEFELASHVQVWLLFLGGGMRLEGLSDLTAVGIIDLKTWALRERLLWVDDEGYYFLYLSALPLVWAAFANKSRACRVHHEVYCHYTRRAEDGSRIREWVEECASTPRWTRKDRLAPRLRTV